ncbi:hypothetical protein ACNKU7_16910 [Microbulbifer sp. SA54]
MNKIVFIVFSALFPWGAFACDEDKVDILKYVTDSRLVEFPEHLDEPSEGGCYWINFLLSPRYSNGSLYLSEMTVKLTSIEDSIVASLPIAILDYSGYRTAYVCLSEKALEKSELELHFLHKSHAELHGDGFRVFGSMACSHTETVRLTSLLETHNKARQ